LRVTARARGAARSCHLPGRTRPMPRRHDIDALRVFAFALLILYHAGMVYVADWGFHIKSGYQAEWLQYPMIFLSRWRMPLLFARSEERRGGNGRSVLRTPCRWM